MPQSPHTEYRPAPAQRAPEAAGRRARAAESDADRLGWALFPVRLFLGVTFVYAGIQKLSDPGYLHPGAPTYIGTQLHGFAHGTPGGFLLRAFAIPHPGLAGVLVAITEIAVGLLVTSGLLTRPAAAVGLALNLVLFLTNSWHTYPYFLGSDIVFVFAWLPFVLVGAARQPTLEPALRRVVESRSQARGRAPNPRRTDGIRSEPWAGETALTRRNILTETLGIVAAATAAIAGLSVLARGTYRAPRTLGAAVPPAKRHTSRTAAGAAPADIAAPGSANLPHGAVKLGAASQLPAGQAATYPDPRDGSPDIVIHETNGTFVAHSAVCTHAGCTVGYQGGQIVCPCHGAVYDAQTGAVISGPAPAPLAPRKVVESGGDLYAIPT